MTRSKTTYEDVLKDLADFMNELERLYSNEELPLEQKKELERIIHSDQAKELQQQRFKLLAENTSDVISLHDSYGNIKYISPAVIKLTGYKPSEYKQFTVLENIYPEDIKFVKTQLAKVGSGQNEVTYDCRILSRTKNPIWVETKTKVLRDENKKVLYWISSTRDIRARKEAEAKLMESKDRFRTSIENMLDAFGMFSAIRKKSGEITDFKIEYLNNAACELHHMTRTEQIGKRMLTIFPESKTSGLFDKYCQVVETGKPLEQDALTYKTLSGKKLIEKAFDIRASKWKDGLVASWRDITQQKKTEKEKRTIEKAISSAVYGFAMADQEGVINYVNDAFLYMWGYNSSDEVLGKHATDFWKDPYAAQKLIYELGRKDGTFDELIAKKKDGTEFPVQIVANTFKDAEGDNPCLMSSFIDISEQKEAEKILKEKEQNLKEKNISKDKFLSIIAHDLKNPFNSIIGFSDLLIKNLDDKQQHKNKQFANIIYSEAKHTLNLLDNLLNWSRSQAGRIKFYPEVTDINKIVLNNILLLKHAANQKNITINYNIENISLIKADQNMLNTILRNLISNAIKFSKEADEIKVIAKSSENCLEISVIDQGIGMKKKELNKLFKIETCSSKRGTNDEGGTGLGLILCKEFVEKHGGEIWAESKYGEGSSFTFTIPYNG